MKLLYIHQYFKFPDENGGTRSYDLAKKFVESGIEVTVISTTNDISFKTQSWTLVSRDGINVLYVYLPYDNSMSYLKRASVFLKFLWSSTIKTFNMPTDLVLATSTPLTVGVPALVKKIIKGTPFIFETRDIWPEAAIAIGAIRNKYIKKCLYFLEGLIYKNASQIVPLSVDMQQSIITRYPCYEEKCQVVIENISEIDRFKYEKGLENPLKALVGFEPRFTVLYAGTFGRVNGVHKIVELANYVKDMDRELVFILIGEGSEKENVKKLAEDYEILNSNVFILDGVTKSELSKWYSLVSMGSSFVIDIKELWSNSANKFFDTLAAKKPILINHEGWQAEKIRKEEIGYVLPFQINVEEAEKFVSYTQNCENIGKQCENAFKVAISDYSLNIASEKYLKIFKSILKSK